MESWRIGKPTCDWQTRSHVFVWQGKPELPGIVVVVHNVDELERDEALVASGKCFCTRVEGFSVDIPLVAQVRVSDCACR